MGYAALVVLTFLWGTTFPFIKVIVEAIGYSYYVLLRFTLASLVIVPVVLARREYRKALRECLAPGLVLGVLFFLGMALQGLGMEYTTASNAAFITGLSVVMVYVFEVAMGREKPSLRLTAAVVLAVLGTYLLSFSGGEVFIVNPGDLIVLAAAFFWAWQIIAVGVYTRKHDFLRLLFYEIVFTAVFGALASAFYPFPSPLVLQSLLPALVYLAVVCTIVANALQLYGQRFTSSVEAAIIYLLEPVFAAILSYILLGEAMSFNQVMGAALILLSMGAATVKPEAIKPQAQLPSTLEPAKQS